MIHEPVGCSLTLHPRMLWLGGAAALVCLLSPPGASAFHRDGVEAAPDSLLPAPAGHSQRQLPYTATGAALTPFYRSVRPPSAPAGGYTSFICASCLFGWTSGSGEG